MADPGSCTPSATAPRQRPFRQAERAALIAQLCDPRVADWLAAIRQPFDTAEADTFLAFAADPAQRVRALDVDGTLIGGMRLGDTLWYWLAPDHWGRGYMTRALREALAERFSAPAPPVVATCREDNAASRALLGRLGFSARPVPRRMFFHGAGTSRACRDHLLTPEQWHLLNPPRLTAPGLVLRPARQADLATVQGLMEGAPPGGPWPGRDEERLRAFLEIHRFRGSGTALWLVEDEARRARGVALAGDGAARMRFAHLQDEERLRAAVQRLLGA